MLRDLLRDAALAAAKSYGHSQVEPRHILYAIARHYRERPDGDRFLRAARAALEPRGSSAKLPELTEDATALLQSLVSDQAALEALSAAIKPDSVEPMRAGAQTQTKSDEAVASTGGTTILPPAETPAAILAELDALIGLKAVKAQVRSVIAVVQANQERTKAGLVPVNSSLHLVFTGPPGTGKTTVARLIARLYAASGALPGSTFTEASRPDLVAAYVGQTALKTAEVVARTRPGVLFIDEAYALTPTHESDFGAEAIATLVKAMEDHRSDLAVIVAGYERETSDFIRSNPGLRSRFKTYIDFPDYQADELALIFERLAEDHGIALESGVVADAKAIFQRARQETDFGNARFARSLFEQAYMRMAARAAADGAFTIDEVTTLRREDVISAIAPSRLDKRQIGFGPAQQ